jgi:hypothetical protein
VSLKYTRSNSPIKGSPPPLRPPHTLPLRPEPIPVATFAELHNARAKGDFALARRLIREMRAYGYAIIPLAPRAKGGPR